VLNYSTFAGNVRAKKEIYLNLESPHKLREDSHKLRKLLMTLFNNYLGKGLSTYNINNTSLVCIYLSDH